MAILCDKLLGLADSKMVFGGRDEREWVQGVKSEGENMPIYGVEKNPSMYRRSTLTMAHFLVNNAGQFYLLLSPKRCSYPFNTFHTEKLSAFSTSAIITIPKLFLCVITKWELSSPTPQVCLPSICGVHKLQLFV